MSNTIANRPQKGYQFKAFKYYTSTKFFNIIQGVIK